MPEEETAKYRLNNPFFERALQFAKNHVLRDIKHGARIPIPDGHHLVGVADEGPAYKAAGHENVYCLPESHIYGECPGRNGICPRIAATASSVRTKVGG